MSTWASGENVSNNPYCPAAWTHVTSSLTKSIDFSQTNYPSVRDLTHRFWTAGGFSDFNHTSMLAPRSNLHCLSPTPAFCQLPIDYYPALALFWNLSLSVSIHQTFVSLFLLAGEKLLGGEESRDDFLVKSPLILCHGEAGSFSVRESREGSGWFSATGGYVKLSMLVVSGVKPKCLTHIQSGAMCQDLLLFLAWQKT